MSEQVQGAGPSVSAAQDRYIVQADGPNRYGVEFWSIVDTRTSEVRATWTVPSYACEQCDWLNARVSP